jgi:hypothetical protein
MNNKIGYVIVREDLFSPVVQTQVIDVLKYMASSSPYNIYLVWFFVSTIFGRIGAYYKKGEMQE